MKIVPVIKSSDLQRSLQFYTEILDFRRNEFAATDPDGNNLCFCAPSTQRSSVLPSNQRRFPLAEAAGYGERSIIEQFNLHEQIGS